MNGLEKILNRFIGKRVLVIGDVMLDRYSVGCVERISPEAPVPIVKVTKEYFKIGGAGNVAANIVSLGGTAILFSFVGNDSAGGILKELLTKNGIEFNLEEDCSTIEKHRILGNNQQMLRVDKEEIREKRFGETNRSALIEIAEDVDVIVVSDYAKGAITEDLISLLRRYNDKVIVDPKPVNMELYRNMFLIKLNRKELFEMTGNGKLTLEEAGLKLKRLLNSYVLVTQDSEGMTLFSEKIVAFPTFAREVYDVTGAGDTVAAALALAIASGSSLDEAAIIANYAAGISIERIGTYAVGLGELKNKILFEEEKVVDL